MAGRDAEKEKRRIMALVTSYLDQATEDASKPLTFAGVARECGISRGHFSKDDPDFEALAQRVVQLRLTRDGERDGSPASPGGSPPTMDDVRAQLQTRDEPPPVRFGDDELDARIDSEVRQAGEIMRRWLGYARSSKGARDSVLLVQDLAKTIAGLHAIHARLHPLAGEKEDRILSDEVAEASPT